MVKQYISTATASDGHKLDVLGLEITEKYTITVSSDGYANFWTNRQPENEDPNKYVSKIFINKMGIHHIAVLENILPNIHVSIVVLAFGCFDGSIVFRAYREDNLETLWEIDRPSELLGGCWCPGFYKDPESKQDYFVVTKADGSTAVYYLNFLPDENVQISFEILGDLYTGSNTSFPNSLAICGTKDKKVAVGYTNGDVSLFDLTTLKPVYTFHSTDLQAHNGSVASNSIPRVLEFSPGGTILAVARDNHSAGSLTLYDVKYGENVGSLTTPTHSSKVKIGGFAHSGWILGLSFDDEGKYLASCGFDNCVRVWDLESRQRDATITISLSDLDSTGADKEMDSSIASGVKFIKKGVRGYPTGDANEGLCVTSFDRGIRWYREAGGS